jgi:hypothetical protein
MRLAGYVAYKGQRGMHIVFWWESQTEVMRTLGRSRRRLENNIKLDLRETGRAGMNWIDQPHDKDQWRAIVNKVISLRVPYNFGNFFSSCWFQR